MSISWSTAEQQQQRITKKTRVKLRYEESCRKLNLQMSPHSMNKRISLEFVNSWKVHQSRMACSWYLGAKIEQLQQFDCHRSVSHAAPHPVPAELGASVPAIEKLNWSVLSNPEVDLEFCARNWDLLKFYLIR